jgi:hypothetical protein
MFRQIWAANHGRRLWAGLARRYKLDQGLYVLVMPEDDEELNAAAIGHVEDLVDDRRAQGIVLVGDASSRPTVAQIAEDRAQGPEGLTSLVGTELWTARQIDALIAFYELYSFTDRLLIVSLTKPFGNGLHRLLGRQGATAEDLVCLGCLRLRSYGTVMA